MQNIQAILPVQGLINNGTTIVLLDSLAEPQSNGIEIEFLSEGLLIE
jgi:hypothetical protein